MLHCHTMTHITPPELERLPLEHHPDGTVTVDGHRFPHPTFGAYTKIYALQTGFAEWLSDIAQEQSEVRADLPKNQSSKEYRPALNKLNALKRRNDFDMKTLLADNLIEALQAVDPDWQAPEDPPLWFGTLGVLERLLQHWEQTPFLGQAQRRASNAAEDQAPQTSSREAAKPDQG